MYFFFETFPYMDFQLLIRIVTVLSGFSWTYCYSHHLIMIFTVFHVFNRFIRIFTILSGFSPSYQDFQCLSGFSASFKDFQYISMIFHCLIIIFCLFRIIIDFSQFSQDIKDFPLFLNPPIFGTYASMYDPSYLFKLMFTICVNRKKIFSLLKIQQRS